MQTSLTPQQQYPKFYANPEYYLGIEVKIKHSSLNGKFREITVTDGITYYGVHLPSGQVQFHDANQLIPLFKPQSGEQFIKDLTEAVKAANIFDYELKYDRKDSKGHYCFIGIKDEHPLLLTVNSMNLSRIAYSIHKDLITLPIDTAAYVDTLRKLGYYL